jgi:DNA recombination protein RmuC
VRQLQAPELVEDATQVEPMVGRAPRSRRVAEPPEAEALWRTDPELDELVAEQAALPQPGEDARREA